MTSPGLAPIDDNQPPYDEHQHEQETDPDDIQNITFNHYLNTGGEHEEGDKENGPPGTASQQHSQTIRRSHDDRENYKPRRSPTDADGASLSAASEASPEEADPRHQGAPSSTQMVRHQHSQSSQISQPYQHASQDDPRRQLGPSSAHPITVNAAAMAMIRQQQGPSPVNAMRQHIPTALGSPADLGNAGRAHKRKYSEDEEDFEQFADEDMSEHIAAAEQAENKDFKDDFTDEFADFDPTAEIVPLDVINDPNQKWNQLQRAQVEKINEFAEKMVYNAMLISAKTAHAFWMGNEETRMHLVQSIELIEQEQRKHQNAAASFRKFEHLLNSGVAALGDLEQ